MRNALMTARLCSATSAAAALACALWAGVYLLLDVNSGEVIEGSMSGALATASLATLGPAIAGAWLNQVQTICYAP